MTESEWLASENPQAMLRHLTHERTSPNGIGTLNTPRTVALVSQRKLKLLDDACFRRFGLTLDDLVVQTTPPPGACNVIRDMVCPFRPVTLPWEYSRPLAKLASAVTPFVNVKVPMHCPWLTPTVVSLAQAAYEFRGAQNCGKCGRLGDKPGEYTPDDGWNVAGKCPTCNGTGTLDDGTLDNARLRVLSDALEEAGVPLEENSQCPSCDGKGGWSSSAGWRGGVGGQTMTTCSVCDGEGYVLAPHPLLAHLRSPGPHYRGMWSLDLILERS